MACTRKLFLDTRWLLPRPVVPLSPVRVAICVSRLPMKNVLVFVCVSVCDRVKQATQVVSHIPHVGAVSDRDGEPSSCFRGRRPLLQSPMIVGQVAAPCLTKDSKAIVCGVNCAFTRQAAMPRHHWRHAHERPYCRRPLGPRSRATRRA